VVKYSSEDEDDEDSDSQHGGSRGRKKMKRRLQGLGQRWASGPMPDVLKVCHRAGTQLPHLCTHLPVGSHIPSVLQAEIVLLLNKLTASLAAHAAAQDAPGEDARGAPPEPEDRAERPLSGASLAERLAQVCILTWDAGRHALCSEDRVPRRR
jgi:hypothetical protein